MQPRNPPVKLTDSVVKKLLPSDKTAFYWDSNLKGFGLTVTKGGIKKKPRQPRLILPGIYSYAS